MGIVRFAIKAGIAGGITYYTIQENLWSEPEKTIEFYDKISNKVAPFVKENIPKEIAQQLPQVPNTGDIAFFVKSTWNKGVITSFKFLSELPQHTSNGIEAIKSSSTYQEAINSFNSPVDTKIQ